MKLYTRLFLCVTCAAALAFFGCGTSSNINMNPAQAQAQAFQVFTGSGTADVNTAIANFQALIGGAANGNAAGTQPTGFRSINWDAGIVPVFPAPFQFDFFNNALVAPPTRGLILGAAGNQMRASNADFAGINPNYANNINPFSNANTFAATSSNVLWASFNVPGATGVPAGVTGFGAVFCDVDNVGTSSIEFFAGDVSLGVQPAPVRNDASGHSFLGAVWLNGVRITSVKITHGDAAMGVGVEDVTDGGTADIAVVDDLFYAEPGVVGNP